MTNTSILQLTKNMSERYRLNLDLLDETRYALWDNYEALICFQSLSTGKIQVCFSLSLDKMLIADMMYTIMKLTEGNITLGPPFYFSYAKQKLYIGMPAYRKQKEEEFYYELIKKAND